MLRAIMIQPCMFPEILVQRMPFEGYLDSASNTEIAGWVYHGDNPNTPLTVEILADGSVLATIIADGFREDLLRAGKGNGNHAFRFSMPAGQSAKSRLRARVTGQPWFIQLCTEAYSRAFAFMLHTCEYGIPEPPFGFAEVPEPDPKTDIPLANRLIAAYHRASRADAKRNNRRTSGRCSNVRYSRTSSIFFKEKTRMHLRIICGPFSPEVSVTGHSKVQRLQKVWKIRGLRLRWQVVPSTLLRLFVKPWGCCASRTLSRGTMGRISSEA